MIVFFLYRALQLGEIRYRPSYCDLYNSASLYMGREAAQQCALVISADDQCEGVYKSQGSEDELMEFKNSVEALTDGTYAETVNLDIN